MASSDRGASSSAGREVEVLVSPLATLQSVLRTQLGQTSVKDGCRQGGCGCCTVLVDGEPMLSCLLPVAGRRGPPDHDGGGAHAAGRPPPGPAGVPRRQRLPVRLLHAGHGDARGGAPRAQPDPSRDEIVDALSGNVCRCTGYEPIIEAIRPPRGRHGGGHPMTADAAEPPRRRRVGRPQRRRRLRHRPGAVHRRPHVPGDAPPADGPQPRPPRPDPRRRPVRGGAVPGFVRALTHEDVPHNVYTILGLIGVEPEEEFVLAVDRVRYRGEPIVAILAETEAAAHEAAATVRLDLEELPAVFDMDEAMAPGRPGRDPLGHEHVHLRGRHQAQGPAGRRRGGLRDGRPHPRGRVPHLARSSTRRPRRPAASPSPRPTAGSRSTPTPRRSTSASTTPRSSSRSRTTGCGSSAAWSAAGSAARST